MVEPKPIPYIRPSVLSTEPRIKIRDPRSTSGCQSRFHGIETKPHAEVVPHATHETIEGCNACEFCGLMDDLLF